VPRVCLPLFSPTSRGAGGEWHAFYRLLLPPDASWLAEFRSELLTFPNGRFDDQVDALAQLLAWARTDMAMNTPAFEAPIFYFEDSEGNLHCSEDDDYEQFLPPDTDDPWGA